MKTNIAVLLMLSLMMATGCRSSVSPQGGAVAEDREFRISIPKNMTMRQGEIAMVPVTLTRGAFFKQDIKLDMTADGLDVKPNDVVVKANERAETKLQIEVPRDAALGEYRVYIKGTPTAGKAASTEFTVKVIRQ